MIYSVLNTGKPAVKRKLLSGSMPDIDSNLANVQAFEEAGKEIFGEWGCLPMIAYGTAKTLSAFKLLARARNIDFDTANAVAKQIQNYEYDVKIAKENNEDDPDYNVDDDIHIESYVEEKYLGLIEESKKYKGIITSISCHPCAHLVYHKDLRREIGVIRVKSKSGNKEPVMAAYIDGNYADKFGYCKSDMLRVDVVKIIHDTFNLVGQPVLSVDELVEKTKDDKAVWDILAKGFTMGCNQVERPKTTERVMQFKPKNTVELAALIAAIRPGAKSLVNYFVARTPHTYNIPSMDKLLKLDGATGVTGESSFLFYDEQIMQLAEAAGIAPEDTNALIKHIKKKHHDDVAKYKEDFIHGFIQYLTQTEHVDSKHAEKTANDVWTVILNSASYLFNLSHAYAMCLDCLYGMYLKTYYPYEFYVTLLKLYDEKKNTDKISAIIAEMKRYKDISLTAGRFGQDNRDWVVDKEHHAISQSLSSIRYMSKKAANDLYKLGCLKKTTEEDMMAVLDNKSVEHTKLVSYDTFTDVLRDIQMNTCLDTRQIRILIELNYFEQFGKSGKLIKVYENFFEGEKKLTKTIKSFEPRLEASRKFEASLPEEELDIGIRLASELSNVGLCMSVDKTQPADIYFVRELDAKYGVKAKLYSVQRGTTGVVRFRKDDFARRSFEEGDCIRLIEYNKSPRYTYKGGEKAIIPGEFDIWARKYSVAPKRN